MKISEMIKQLQSRLKKGEDSEIRVCIHDNGQVKMYEKIRLLDLYENTSVGTTIVKHISIAAKEVDAVKILFPTLTITSKSE